MRTQIRQCRYRSAKPGDQGRCLRTRTQFFLLLAAKSAGQNTHALAHIQSAYSLGAVDLVGGDGHQVYPQLVRPQGHLAKGLHTVGMDQRRCAGLLYRPANALHRQNAAHFVVDAHDGDQNGVRGDGAFNLLLCNIAGFVRLQANDLKALCLQLVGSLYNALVFNGGGHNALAPPPVGIGCTKQSQVVGLRAAGGESQRVSLHPQSVCQCAAGGDDLFHGVNPRTVQAGGIGKVVSEHAAHGRHTGRAGSGGGCVV